MAEEQRHQTCLLDSQQHKLISTDQLEFCGCRWREYARKRETHFFWRGANECEESLSCGKAEPPPHSHCLCTDLSVSRYRSFRAVDGVQVQERGAGGIQRARGRRVGVQGEVESGRQEDEYVLVASVRVRDECSGDRVEGQCHSMRHCPAKCVYTEEVRSGSGSDGGL